MKNSLPALFAIVAAFAGLTATSAGAGSISKSLAHPAIRAHAKMVAYDAKDRKYYSVAYAKANGMHDHGGDPLIIIARSRLPKDAKLSHAMHGVEP